MKSSYTLSHCSKVSSYHQSNRLKEESICEVTIWNEQAIAVEPPNNIDVKVTETDPGLRGDTAQGGVKPAIVETGASIRVPLFIEEGEIIKVDTRTGEYLSRVK